MTLTQGSPSHRMAIRWLQLIYTENWRVLFPYYYYSPKRPVLAVTHKSRSDHSPRPNVSTGTLEAVIPSTRVRSLMLRPGTHAVSVCFALLPATAIRASILEIETTAADLLPGSRPCLAGWVGSGDCSRCSCCCAQTRSPTAPSSWCSSSQSSSSRTRLLLARWHLLHLIHSQSFTDSSLFASFPRFPLLRPFLDRLLFQCLNPHTLTRMAWKISLIRHRTTTSPSSDTCSKATTTTHRTEGGEWQLLWTTTDGHRQLLSQATTNVEGLSLLVTHLVRTDAAPHFHYSLKLLLGLRGPFEINNYTAVSWHDTWTATCTALRLEMVNYYNPNWRCVLLEQF